MHPVRAMWPNNVAAALVAPLLRSTVAGRVHCQGCRVECPPKAPVPVGDPGPRLIRCSLANPTPRPMRHLGVSGYLISLTLLTMK